jgi:hypothetical protein
MTDWEKQKLNMRTKNAYVELGLLPMSIHKFKQPPPSTVTGVEVAKTNATESAVANTPSLLEDARSVERQESPPLQVEAPPPSPPLQVEAPRPQKLGPKGKIQEFLFQDMTASLLMEVIPPIIESRCQCDLCAKNVVPLPHVCGDFARESQVFIDAVDESTDFEFFETDPLPLPTAILSMDEFRIHQQLNHVVSTPAAVPVPFPFFPQQPLRGFPFPFPSVQQLGVLPRQRKRARAEREFQCLCEKQRHEQTGPRKRGPAVHSVACKLSKLLHP